MQVTAQLLETTKPYIACNQCKVRLCVSSGLPNWGNFE